MARRVPTPGPVPKGRTPVTTTPERGRKPRPGAPPPPKLWTFSFRFWKEIPDFGLDRLREVTDRWFVSLLERLHDLGSLTVDEARRLLGRHDGLAGALRFHKIDHDHPHVTIARSDLNWVEKTYIEDEDEYPILQFQISKALGRVIGFFDEEDVFNVVLLDPHHNAWLSDYSDYKIRPCSPLGSHYIELRALVDAALAELDGRPDENARVRAVLSRASIHGQVVEEYIRLVVALERKDERDLRDLLERSGVSIRAIVERGVLVLLEEGDETVEDTIDATIEE